MPYGYLHLVIWRPQVWLTSGDQCGRLRPFRRCQPLPDETFLVSQHLLILTHAPGGRWYTQVIIVIIRTKTTSVDPDPCVKWQADIPKWLFVQRQHLLILTHASSGRRIYPSDYPYKDNIGWSWPMHQLIGRYTQVIIRTKTTSVNPDPCVNGRRKYPQWLFVQTQFCYPDLWEVR